MKKRIISLFMVFAVVSTCILPALAAPGFDKSVFRNAEDILASEDEMGGSGAYSIDSLFNANNSYYFQTDDDTNRAVIYVRPMVTYTDRKEQYLFIIDIYARENFYTNQVTIKVGNRRYVFTNPYTDFETYENICEETTLISMDADTLKSLMNDIIEHRDEEIKVRISGDDYNADITMADFTKDGVIHLYNLFVQAGGLRQENAAKLATKQTTVDIYED